MKPESKIAFLPIKPIYAQRIVEGIKGFEFRRTVFQDNINYLIIYACAPVKKIIAIASIEKIDIGSPTSTWEATKNMAGISRSEYRSYFQGCKRAVAIKVKEVIRLKKHIEPKQINATFKVPQSFSYVDQAFLQKVLRFGNPVS